jgi:hypothetical protein
MYGIIIEVAITFSNNYTTDFKLKTFGVIIPEIGDAINAESFMFWSG